MNLLSTALLALAMSTDAFAAAVGKGMALRQPRWREALRTGAIFGAIEGLTPVLGWAMGLAAADHVKAWVNGGATDESNCQMLCKTHNRSKGNR